MSQEMLPPATSFIKSAALFSTLTVFEISMPFSKRVAASVLSPWRIDVLRIAVEWKQALSRKMAVVLLVTPLLLPPKTPAIHILSAALQIIKSSAISRAIQSQFSEVLEEVIVHTGQHYDENMSEVFFQEMGIPRPNYNLNVGSGSHGAQTAKMIEGLEEIFIKEAPTAVLVYGDTNSTIAIS